MIITITVSGPGGAINAEVEMIRRLLADGGFNVEVINQYPSEPEELQRAIDYRYTKVELRNQDTYYIVADHVPWGG